MKKVKRSAGKFGLNNGEILGVPVFGRGVDEVLKIVKGWVEEKKGKPVKVVATVNPEFVVKAIKDPEFGEILATTDLNVIDGIGLVWAGELRGFEGVKKWWRGVTAGVEILGGGYRERVVAGADLTDRFCRLGVRVGFVGGWGDRAERTKKYFEKKYPNFEGVALGRKYDRREEKIFEILKKEKVRILLVAYGMGGQEGWIMANKENLTRAGVKVVMGVGRSFDYYSGDLPRAPEWLRRMGLEWLFSLLVEPKRWRRQLALPEFIWRSLRA